MDNTKRLEHLQGQKVKVTFNICGSVQNGAFTCAIEGTLRVMRQLYEIETGKNWIHFTDSDIAAFDGESPFWVELKIKG